MRTGRVKVPEEEYNIIALHRSFQYKLLRQGPWYFN